jgi:hypothetical protein
MITVHKSKPAVLITLIFVIYLAFWLAIRQFTEPGSPFHNLFADTYVVLAIVGTYYAMKTSEDWGGSKSLMGNALFYLGFGVVAQIFGQLSYTAYFLITKVDAPYPSLGDFGYFGSIICYIYGLWILAKALQIKINRKNIIRSLPWMVIPLGLLFMSYVLFLKGYEYDWSDPVIVFLDFGYPLGQSLYVSLSLIILALSKDALGGIMRPRIMILLMALIFQFAADYMFLYQQSREAWVAGGTNDLLYLVAYFAMSMALVGFGEALDKIRATK